MARCRAYEFLIQSHQSWISPQLPLWGLVWDVDDDVMAREEAIRAIPPGIAVSDVDIFIKPWNAVTNDEEETDPDA